MGRTSSVAIILVALALLANSALAQANHQCRVTIPPGEVALPCSTGSVTAVTAVAYQFDNSLNTSTAYFQVYNSSYTTYNGTTPVLLVGVPAGTAEIIPVNPTSGDNYPNGIVVACSAASKGNAPLQRGCSYVIWYHY